MVCVCIKDLVVHFITAVFYSSGAICLDLDEPCFIPPVHVESTASSSAIAVVPKGLVRRG